MQEKRTIKSSVSISKPTSFSNQFLNRPSQWFEVVITFRNLNNRQTLDIYDALKANGSHAKSSCRLRLRRHVTFDEELNQEYYFDEVSNNDRLWYQEADICRFKDENKAIIKQVRQEEKWNDGLWSIYKMLQLLYNISSDIEYELEDACAVMCPKNQMLIRYLLSHLYNSTIALETIGLEKNFVPAIKRDLERRQKAAQDVVEEIQCEYDQGLWSDAQISAELRDCCRNYSQTSCLYFQLLGKIRSELSW